MEYVRLRSPAESGQTLVMPPLASASERVEQNHIAGQWADASLAPIREIARQELAGLALKYTRQYADVSDPVNSDRIVFSGHQPRLFHPGVWFKNFALSQIAKNSNSVSINLVVDNDLCNTASIALPRFSAEGKVGLSHVSFDDPGQEIPFEARTILNRELFAAFGQEVAERISPIVSDPIVKALWPRVMQASDGFTDRIGAAIAAGRHRLELQNGIQNLELPVSVMAGSVSFANFFALVVQRSAEFSAAYNESLAEYRILNRIRSRSHPVPELELRDRWQELPFWCWHRETPRRRRLFVKHEGGTRYQATDHEGWTAEFELPSGSSVSLDEVFGDVLIRPRALATTMFVRMFACDLFLHGIGGAKYDQLTDQIAKSFWGDPPPPFMTVTATQRLPFGIEAVTREQIVGLQREIREIEFHPERFASGEGSVRLRDEKADLLKSIPSEGSRKEWHDRMVAVNRQFADLLAQESSELQSKLKSAKDQLAAGRIIASREFPFALFPAGLVDELRGSLQLS